MNKDLHTLEAYDYDLPQELIAQYPKDRRDRSRLMVIDRKAGTIEEMVFRDIVDFLGEGDQFIFNDTRVIPARLFGHLPTGGKVEIFLTRHHVDDVWEVLCKPARKLKEGTQVSFGEGFSCTVEEVRDEGLRLVSFNYSGDFEENLKKFGQIPLPHYIQRDPNVDLDSERYQTVYAKNPGAVAAPTAGLHFSEELLQDLKGRGVDTTYVTLHVGLGTFKPVNVDNILDHKMHHEYFSVSPEAADKLNGFSGKRQISVGTTCCRTLEAAADDQGKILAGERDTNLFIYPGYRFKYVRSLLTNFHLPKSSLMMLVSAFAGYDLIMEAYAKAVEEKYRFFSYGDAMLII